MFLRQLLDERHGCASYLIACNATGEAAVVDPGIATAWFDRLLAERGLRLRYVVDTHVHADHVSGARTLARDHGADLCLHSDAPVAYAHRPISDGQALPLGRLRVDVLHIPGHRPELVSLLLSEPDRGLEPVAVLTGDALLAGDAGRPDFAGGDAAAQHRSLARLLALPEWVMVLPGHVDGPCGAAMSGAHASTVGYERRTNPLAALDRDAFVVRLSDSIPARPLNQVAIESTNRGEADMPWAMLIADPALPEVPDAALRDLGSEALLVDVREPAEFAAGHAPGAINVPQAELAQWQSSVPTDRDLLLICQSGRRSLRAGQFLVQLGFVRVSNVAGGTTAWTQAGGALDAGHGDLLVVSEGMARLAP
jgi:glyoxylase-like metal-dependent hydrolase (beta-lactamase superfamily II)/rhodanese-related sulfurtransferase